MAEKQDKAGCGMQIFAFLLLAGLILLVGWFGSRQCDKWAAENSRPSTYQSRFNRCTSVNFWKPTTRTSRMPMQSTETPD